MTHALLSARRRSSLLACTLLLVTSTLGQRINRLEVYSFYSPHLDESGLGAARSIGVVPDLDGDGFDDLALGADKEDDGAGRVYVLSGKTGTLLYTLASPRPVEAEAFGQSVAGMRDLDGDGRGDFVVGATGADPAGTRNSGRVYVYSGATGTLLGEVTSPHAADSGAFGFDVAAVPDVDGDGRDDFAVGAPDEDALNPQGELQSNVGRAYLFSGATRALLAAPVSVNPDEYFPSAFGSIRGSDFGYSVDGLPDADGDARGDLLVAAPGEWTGDFDNDLAKYDGRLYLFRPAAQTAAVYRSLDPEDRGDFTNCVAGTPDLTGDGRGDILVGAPDESGRLDDDGQVYLLSGATGETLRRFSSPEPTDDSSFGACVGVMPDLDLDGSAELFVIETQSCCDKADALYVYDGATNRLVYSIEMPTIPWDITDVAGLADVDGDGRGEIVLGFAVGTFDELHGVTVFSGDLARSEVEPNDRLDQAQLLAGPGPRTIESFASGEDDGLFGSIFVTDSDDDRDYIEDLYRIDLVETGLTLALDGLDEDMDLYLFRPDLTIAGQSTQGSTTAEAISLPALEAGTYYVGVSMYGEFGDVSNDFDYSRYTLTVDGALSTATSTAPGAAVPVLALDAAPNPFRDRVRVTFTLSALTHARVAVYDLLGREVAVLHDAWAAPGAHEAVFEAAGVAAGVYLVRLDAGGRVVTRPFVRVQ